MFFVLVSSKFFWQMSPNFSGTCERFPVILATRLYTFRDVVPPRFTGADELSEADVNEGSPLHLNCKINAVPSPQLTWLKDGLPVTTGPGLYIYPGGRTLQIVSAKWGIAFCLNIFNFSVIAWYLNSIWAYGGFSSEQNTYNLHIH